MLVALAGMLFWGGGAMVVVCGGVGGDGFPTGPMMGWAHPPSSSR